ncbi:MAG: hypothetical protein LQ351_007102 [Letrouitia transgressa]|nr:MAG: hypothetical protein LQ351_007102 [Letrouitia transgressa]
MGTMRSQRREWIQIDCGYLDRVHLRKHLVEKNHGICIGANEEYRPAIQELYDEMMGYHLPKRFPAMFSVKKGVFKNRITGAEFPTSSMEMSTAAMLEALAETVEEDFYFMCPDDDGDFRLQAYNATFPQGLLSSSRLGWSVRQIHQPVPTYEGRLANGVDKYFRRMRPGDFVARLNWSIQSDGDNLFCPVSGNTLMGEEPEESGLQRPEIDLYKTYLRCEHHTLTCLPKTKAIMFCVRSYLYPMTDIKNEGNGPALADACDSMPEKFGVYKRRPLWGEQLCTWLREDQSIGDKSKD